MAGHRISKLQNEVSQLRETLDTDQEALQDTIDELREQINDNENKLIAAYDKIQELSGGVSPLSSQDARRVMPDRLFSSAASSCSAVLSSAQFRGFCARRTLL